MFDITDPGDYYFLFNESTLLFAIVKNETISFRNITDNITGSIIQIKSLGDNSFVIQNVKDRTLSVYNSQGVVVYSQRKIKDNQ